MTDQQSVFIQSLNKASLALVSGTSIINMALANIFDLSLSTRLNTLLLNTPFYTTNAFTNSPILIERDSEKEYMDIDYRNLEKDKVYLINYQGETYAVAKKSDNEIVFNDVIKS